MTAHVATQRRWEYLRLLESAKAALEIAVDCFNRVHNPYRNESTLILLTNAWELLAKALLVQKKQSIWRGRRGETISAEVAVHRLRESKILDELQAHTIQQVISLRHAATHHVLPTVDEEIMQHLLFFSCKFFKETAENAFPKHARDLNRNFLSLSFTDLTTYADKVQKSISRARKSSSDRDLVWLLERGVAFDGSAYLTAKEVESKYRNQRTIAPHLRIGDFVRKADMVRVVPVQAPKNFTADVTLRKGSATDSTLPVIFKRSDLDVDYPFLTSDLARLLGRNLNWTAKAASVLGLKGDEKFHKEIRTSVSGTVQRYSESARDALESRIKSDPHFNPYR